MAQETLTDDNETPGDDTTFGDACRKITQHGLDVNVGVHSMIMKTLNENVLVVLPSRSSHYGDIALLCIASNDEHTFVPIGFMLAYRELKRDVQKVYISEPYKLIPPKGLAGIEEYSEGKLWHDKGMAKKQNK